MAQQPTPKDPNIQDDLRYKPKSPLPTDRPGETPQKISGDNFRIVKAKNGWIMHPEASQRGMEIVETYVFPDAGKLAEFIAERL